MSEENTEKENNVLVEEISAHTEETPESPLPTIDLESTYSGEDTAVPTIPQLCVALSILAIVLGSPYLMHTLHLEDKMPLVAQKAEIPTETPPTTVHEDLFANVSVEAAAVYVWDVAAQKALYNKNAHTQLPLASLTKLMTALVAYETYGSDGTVPITLEAIGQEGENGFEDGDTWDAKKLLDFTLMSSSNDGAYALAAAAGTKLTVDDRDPEKTFVRQMNTRAKEIGLTQTYFTNPTGLDASESQSGSYGSARDMAFLMEYIIRNKPEVLESTNKQVEEFSDKEGTLHTATNTNQAVVDFTNLLGSKTGYTLLAGGNLVIAFDAGLNHPIIVSVLGSSREGRFTDVATLAKRAQMTVAKTP